MVFLAKHKEILILSILILAFFYIYSFSLGFQSVSRLNSPDETANYFWIQHFAQTHSLSYQEPLNSMANNLLRPRSVNIVGSHVVPGSFLGQIIIYGWLAKVLTIQVIPFLTPFFACVGVIFFYLIVALFFNKKIGLISALLVLFFPGWWYYAARGMYHQILFIVLLLIGVYLLLVCLGNKSKQKIVENQQIVNNQPPAEIKIHVMPSLDALPKKTNLYIKLFFYFLSGCFLGLSIITRTSEIVWIGLSVLVILVAYFKKIFWPGILLFVCGMLIGVLPMLYYNQILYGSFISAGYTTAISQQGIISSLSSGLLFKMLVAPFGLNPKSILINGFNYLFRFLPLWSIPSLIGFLLFILLPGRLTKIKNKTKVLLTIYYLLVIVYLLIFYGSWSVIDRIDQSAFSLGTSYLRYWLPIYLLLIPFISRLIGWFINLFKYKWLEFIVLFFIILFMFLPSASLVLTDTDESLININQSRLDSQNKFNLIQQKLPHAGVVIVTYPQADKIFFPEYKRLVTALVVPADYLALSRLTKLTDIYYYTFAPPQTVEYISKQNFEEHGLRIIRGQKVFKNDFLYKIIKINNAQDLE